MHDAVINTPSVLSRRGYTQVPVADGVCLLAHASGVSLVCLAPDHPLCAAGAECNIEQVDFRVSDAHFTQLNTAERAADWQEKRS